VEVLPTVNPEALVVMAAVVMEAQALAALEQLHQVLQTEAAGVGQHIKQALEQLPVAPALLSSS
jgi:hypothetical protein